MLVSIAVLLFYLFWGIVSIFAQGDNHLKDKVKAADVFNLVPNYRFFCPDPIRHDYHLYYRGRFPDEQLSEWSEVSIGRRNSWIAFIWNPFKRERKIFYKTVKIIRRKTKSGTKKSYGSTYRALIHFIQNQAHLKDTTSVQFKITFKQDFCEGSEESIFHTSAFYTSINRS